MMPKSELVTSFSKPRLKNREAITAKKITSILSSESYHRNVIDTEIVSFPLRKITLEELKELRCSKIPSFVLKENGIYYHAEIDPDLNLVSTYLMGPHKCADANEKDVQHVHTCCSRLSPSSDEEGGCAKVRNYSTEIENYSFISIGYETFNTYHDAFCVAECSHCKPYVPKDRPDTKHLAELKLGLAQYVWPEVETLAEAREKYHQKKGA